MPEAYFKAKKRGGAKKPKPSKKGSNSPRKKGY